MAASAVKLLPGTWTLVATAPAGTMTFQNQSRGDIWLRAAGSLPTGTPLGLVYAANEGETDITMAILFPAGGANLYAYSQLNGQLYFNAA